ncbi:IS110 family transposase [Kaistella sp. G5-32]|uniref:IS110 family transposase n=1 Tax=Kaistella gelatinilytica TaxID=2787636 RepID=A0ABS0FD65_9FLAO|nr:IS110 family transposase [Kaistella gelatinilytica]MBF8457644.1 IS110 family transposase [Kaistella gelatinilytica]
MSNLLKKVIGVDVGAKFLTVSFNDHCDKDQVHNIENNQRSILVFLKKISTEDYCFVIEATGNYSSRLLHLSLEKGFESSLINCMSVKHFSRMKNIITKTDAEDAKLIRLYGEMFRPDIYVPKSIQVEHLDQEIKLLNDLEEEKRRYAVKLKAIRYNPHLNPNTEKHYEKRLKQLGKEIQEVEMRLPQLQDEEFKEIKDLLQSVSGIGEKTSLQLMTATSGFKNFHSAKSLVKYFGLAPRIYQSGKKSYSPGKCRTSKTHIRGMLYVCSRTAMKHNAPCKELYLRLLAKGKPKKVALIAVCNKLLRICFGVVKNKIAYQQDYQKNLKILT